jgi:uncharacterized protein YcfJ
LVVAPVDFDLIKAISAATALEIYSDKCLAAVVAVIRPVRNAVATLKQHCHLAL